VLCLNGFLGGTKSWDFLSRELMTKHDDISIIGYDFPGFGGSTLPNYFFTFGNLHGFSIFCILKELGWEDAHIVGHSQGSTDQDRKKKKSRTDSDQDRIESRTNLDQSQQIFENLGQIRSVRGSLVIVMVQN